MANVVLSPEPGGAGRWRIHQEELPCRAGGHGSVCQLLPTEAGEGHSNIYPLERNLTVIETRYVPNRDLAVESRIDSQEPRLVLTLGLEGRSAFVSRRGEEIAFREGYATITTFDSSLGERRYAPGKPVRQMRFSVDRSWLETHFGETPVSRLFGKRGIQVLGHHPISYQGVISARQVLARALPEGVENAFLRGQALSILASELGDLFDVERKGLPRPDEKDKAIAARARDILSAEYRNPPTVEALARRVGTNQLKLKRLFHRYFQRTPYGMVLDVRMATAYRLLETGRCPVAVVADSVGYRHPNNFSVAFLKYFGFPPKLLARKK